MGSASITMTGRRPNLIGKPAYMSPEQARGEAVGVQSDIWAFGALLYEMLTGTSSFGRGQRQKRWRGARVAAGLLGVAPGTSRLARRVVELCLEKNLSRRMQDMGDVRILLEDALASPDRDVPAARPAGIRRRSAWVAAGVAAGVLAGMALWLASTGSGNEKPSAPIHVVVPFLERAATFPLGQRTLAISADGSTIALAGVRRLWIRRFNQKNSISVEIGPASHPFFSPEGEWIGLFTETALVKVPSGGGSPAVITSVTDRPAGGTWRADGTIVYATSEGLYRDPGRWRRTKAHCSARSRAQEDLYGFPQFLPGGQSIVFTLVSQEPTQAPQTVMLDLTTLERKVVLTGSSARYLASGELLYVAESGLHAVAFDASSGGVTSKPISVADVEIPVTPDNGAANFAVSDTGTLIFAPLPRTGLRALAWLTRKGHRDPLPLEPQNYGYTMVSPDGSRIAVERTTRGNRDIWVVDLKRMSQTQLTDGPTEDMLPSGAPTGRACSSGQDASATSTSIRRRPMARRPPEWNSPRLSSRCRSPQRPRANNSSFSTDIATCSCSTSRGPLNCSRSFNSRFDERLADVSPDGRWIAYESNESGKQVEVIVRSFPNVERSS